MPHPEEKSWVLLFFFDHQIKLLSKNTNVDIPTNQVLFIQREATLLQLPPQQDQRSALPLAAHFAAVPQILGCFTKPEGLLPWHH